jgi:CheY-like chemotaxis protein
MMPADEFLVLLVEDNADSREAALADIARALPQAKVDWAGDLESAVAAMQAQEYDLAVCDLKIPARAGELTTSEANGVRVVSELQASHPGTIIVILSAYGTVENTEPFTSNGELLQAFGLPAVRMCQAAVKAAAGDFFGRVDAIRVGVEAMSGVEVVGVDTDNLDVMLVRAIAHAAAEQGFTKAEITRAGGLSGASNAIVVLSAGGRPTKRLFVKVDRRAWLLDELRRRREYVEGVLDASNWAQTVSVLTAGLREKAAYFSSLATDPVSLFELARANVRSAVDVLNRTELALAPWRLSRSDTPRTIGDLRRLHMSDEELAHHRLDLTEFEDIESISCETEWDIVHGDLHPENVLVVDGGRPILIDFAYTETGPAQLDPITLEMAFLFHPASPLRQQRERPPIDFARWADGNYLAVEAVAPVLTYCREWALRRGTRESFLAVSYAHAVRHLKRPNVNRNEAWAVVSSCADAIRRSAE